MATAELGAEMQFLARFIEHEASRKKSQKYS